MANHKSAEKRARQTIKRTERNRFYRTRLKNMTRAVKEAVEAKDVDAAKAALKVVNQNFHSLYLFRRHLLIDNPFDPHPVVN